MKLFELAKRTNVTKEFPRSVMPQIKKADLDNSQFKYKKGKVALDKLMPVQSQRVKGMHDKAKNGFNDGTIRPIIIDKYNYIVNGHHRFDVAVGLELNKVKVLKVDATIEELIDYYSNTADDQPTMEDKWKEALDKKVKKMPKKTTGSKSNILFNLGLANENFADGKKKGKSKPGRVKKAGASCKGSVTDLRAKAKKYSGERGKMYHWCANMKSGKN
jgi:hypothetical protein|tara:strand:- start:6721 stop:7371 length:651 start_codon:yes stop_codon:yes gene_type:complete